jgi:[ribosomal protein S5]-alanine N-acetyltransferase
VGPAVDRPRLEAASLSRAREPDLEGAKVRLRPLTVADAPALLELRRRNEDFLAPREPRRPVDYLTLAAQESELREVAANRVADRGYAFGIVHRDKLVGRIALNNIVRGVFQNAYLGYFVGQEHNGQGIATDAVRAVVAHAFDDLALHRVQAAVMLDNPGSMRVLEKSGFRREGVARRYLQIDGRWVDHVLFGVTVEDPRPSTARPAAPARADTHRSAPII